MRLAAQVKGGYYPAHEDAVAHAASFLQAPAGEPFTILDPCAGEGAALRQLAEQLACPQVLNYAIELDESRATTLQGTMRDAHVLAPADFFSCRASIGSFSFIWLNPPFDDSYGGSRVEERFLWRATDWLMPGGVLALVCPQDVVGEYSDARKHLARHYEHIRVIPFPKQCRPFNEVIVFGYRRNKVVVDRAVGQASWEVAQAPKEFRYRIPPGTGPRCFEKTEPTEPELQRMLASSLLRQHLKSPLEAAIPSPPLPLGTGHVALLLASGHLDGVVQPEGKLPHVVRGTSRKHSFISDVTDTENEDGSTTTRTTISERIDLVIRTVDCSGRIRTFSEIDAEDE